MRFKRTLSAILYLFMLSVVMPAHSGIAGPARDYNVFVFGDFSSSNSDTEGNLAAGGNVNVSSYAVATKVSGSNGARLVSDGTVNGSNGGVGSGSQNGAIYASITNLNSFTANGGVHPQNQVDFAAAETQYQDLSTSWRNLTANGTTANLYGNLNLTGTDASLNIFTLAGSDLTNTNTVDIFAPIGSTVLINVSGSGQTFQNGQVQLHGIDSGNVIYNFFESTDIILAGSKNPNGSILAAWADVTGGYGAMDGQLIAQSFDGNTEFHNVAFNGTIVPIPAAFWLFGSAFGFITLMGRSRKLTS